MPGLRGPTQGPPPGGSHGGDTRERGARPRLAARSLYWPRAFGPVCPRPLGATRGVAWGTPRRRETPRARGRTHPRARGKPQGARRRNPVRAREGPEETPGARRRGYQKNEVRDLPRGLGRSTQPQAFGPVCPRPLGGHPGAAPGRARPGARRPGIPRGAQARRDNPQGVSRYHNEGARRNPGGALAEPRAGPPKRPRGPRETHPQGSGRREGHPGLAGGNEGARPRLAARSLCSLPGPSARCALVRLGPPEGVAPPPGPADRTPPGGAQDGHTPKGSPSGNPMGRRGGTPVPGPKGPTRGDTPGLAGGDTRERGCTTSPRGSVALLGPPGLRPGVPSSVLGATRGWPGAPGARRPETPRGRGTDHALGSPSGNPMGRAGGTQCRARGLDPGTPRGSPGGIPARTRVATSPRGSVALLGPRAFGPVCLVRLGGPRGVALRGTSGHAGPEPQGGRGTDDLAPGARRPGLPPWGRRLGTQCRARRARPRETPQRGSPAGIPENEGARPRLAARGRSTRLPGPSARCALVPLGAEGGLPGKPQPGAPTGHPKGRASRGPGQPLGGWPWEPQRARRRNPSAGAEGAPTRDTPGAREKPQGGQPPGERGATSPRGSVAGSGPRAFGPVCPRLPLRATRGVALGAPSGRRPETPRARGTDTHPQGSHPGYPRGAQAGTPVRARKGPTQGTPQGWPAGIPENEGARPRLAAQSLYSEAPRAFGPVCHLARLGPPEGWPWGRGARRPETPRGDGTDTPPG